MHTIEVITSNDKVWNLSQVHAEMSYAIQNHLPMTIDLNTEGPDFESLGLTDFLQTQSARYDYDLSSVILHTFNVLEKCSFLQIHAKFPKHHLTSTLTLYDCHVEKTSDLKHFGLFVHRNNAPRLILSSHIWSRYRDKALHTNHFNRHEDFHLANIGIEQAVIAYQDCDPAELGHYLVQCPINAGSKDKDRAFHTNPAVQVLLNDAQEFLAKYQKFAIEIVCESYYTGQTFCPTEKTWRPMLLMTPFIVQGPKNYLKNLKNMGFKTFDQWWDEGYDEDPPEWSIIEIKKLIDWLSSKSATEIEHMLADMSEILDHNRNLFLSMAKNPVSRVMLPGTLAC